MRILTLALAGNVLVAADLDDELLAATRKGDLAAVKSLLDRGASINAKSAYGSTALFFACDKGHMEIVKLLVERGAELNTKDTFYGFTPLMWAAQKDRLEIVLYLLDHGAKSADEILMMAVQANQPKAVKALLDRGKLEKPVLTQALAAAMRAKAPEIEALLKAAGATPPDPVKAVQLDEATLRSYAGTYGGGRGGTEFDMVFEVKDGQLSAALTGQPALVYSATSKTQFRNDQFGVTLDFVVENGAVTGFKLGQGGQTLEFKRKAGSK